MAVDLTHCLLRKISHRKDKCKTVRTSRSHSGGWRRRLPWVAVMENDLNTDCFIVGLPHSPVGNLQRGNLCNSEIICIIFSGVMSYCSSHKDSFLSAQRMFLSERRKDVSPVCVRLDLRFGTVVLSSSHRQLFPGEHNAQHHFQLIDIFLKHLSVALWVLMGF